MRMNLQQYLAHEAKFLAPLRRQPDMPEPVESESDLHDQIIAYCKGKGWYYVRSRMDRKTTQAVGCPDFIIAADAGRSFWIECKAKNGKGSPAQLETIVHLLKLGHKSAFVWSFEEFLSLVNSL